MKYFIHVLKNYANFNGRSRRKEYWMYILFYYLFLMLVVFLDNLLEITIIENIPYGPLSIGYLLLLIIPTLAVAVRRLHDIGKSGWWMLISLVPLIGGIWFFILSVTDSQLEENIYGKNPKLSS
jgi:uncharacterized membrane protein YhaH (DUF805 family)